MKINSAQQNDNHIIHYLILFTGMSLYLFFMFAFQGMKIYQIVTAAIGSIFYMLWGLLHHYFEGRLNQLVALEYILFGSFIFLLLLGVLNL